MIFCMLCIPVVLIPMAGLAIDATILRIVQARLSAAVDGAALGAGRLLGTSASPSSMATEFVDANFQTGTAGFWGANNLQVSTTYTPGITKTIVVNATADVPLLFIQIFGQRKATVSAAATATRTDSRIMLVIDRSGSMARTKLTDGNYPITDAVNDAIEFTNSFNAGQDEVGLIVFDGSAYVAYPTYTPGTYTTTPSASGGPDKYFNTVVSPATVGPMITLLQGTSANNGSTNTSEALWLAYVELQKAHLRDIAGGTTDTRINAIVLMTDGVPQSVTIYPNNVTSYPSNYFMASSGSSCTNLYTSTNHNPSPIIGYMTIPANGSGSNEFTSGSSVPGGSSPVISVYQRASTDSTSSHTARWWVGSGAGQNLTLNPQNAVGCTHLFGTTGKDLSQIPSVDAYGNTMSGSNYLKSQYVDGTGNITSANPILAGGHLLNQNQVYSGIDWVQSQWNATDSAGSRIRSDVNLANRAGDTKMPIYIYTIGFLGDGGCDQGLLARIANDASLSSAYDSTTPAGKYYPATDEVALHNAFETIAATILRLSK